MTDLVNDITQAVIREGVRGRVSETDFMAHLRAALNAPGRNTRVVRINAGVHAIRDERGKRRSTVAGAPKGSADLSGIIRAPLELRGLRLEVEVKSATGKQTKEQADWQKFIEDWGGVYVLVKYERDHDLDENIRLGVAAVDAAIAKRWDLG